MRQIRLTEPYEVIEPELYALIRGDLDQQIEQPHDVGGPDPLAHVQKVAEGLLGEKLHEGDGAERHQHRERYGQ